MDGRELPRDGIRLSFSLDGLKEASSGYTFKYWKQGKGIALSIKYAERFNIHYWK
jgi:hypothetical protein